MFFLSRYSYIASHHISTTAAVIALVVFPLFVISLVGFSYYQLVIKRKKKLKRFLAEAQQTDQYWNESIINSRIIEVYKQIQVAWNSGKVVILRGFVTENFVRIYGNSIANGATINFDPEVLELLKIEVEILGIMNYKINDYDRFSALIKIDGKDAVIYHFERFANQWILDGIQIDVSFNGKTVPPVFRER